MGKGIFGDLFDFNHDGELDTFERAMEFETFREMMKDDEEVDVDQDEDERREVLEDAGLDPDDYDLKKY